MTTSSRGMRLCIGVFGKRNAGKSSLVNRLVGQEVSIVSPSPGTTTDPVEKAMEFPPLGPVVFVDTAGLDDEGELGSLRTGRTRSVMERTDVALLVFEGEWGRYEEELYEAFHSRSIPVIAVASKADCRGGGALSGVPDGTPVIEASVVSGTGLEGLRQAILGAAPESFIESPVIVRDLVPSGGVVVLVIPLDEEAPRGRLILPQVQTMRDLLDGDCVVVACREGSVSRTLEQLRERPSLVVTDSQVFDTVAGEVGEGVLLTGFSILFARAKGDLPGFAAGAAAIGRLKAGSRVLVAESCSHHSGPVDIGKVKLPELLRKRTGGKLDFEFVSGHDFPGELDRYSLILQCGGCMSNRRGILSRQARAFEAGTPMTNYGMAIAYCMGLLERGLEPFPEALAAFNSNV